MLKLPIPSLALLALLVPPAAAQGGNGGPHGSYEPSLYYPPGTELAWPEGADFGENGPFRRMVLGDHNDDGQVDGVVLRDDRIVFLYGLQVYQSFYSIDPSGPSFLDVATLVTEGRADTIVATAPGGLYAYDHDPQANTFVQTVLNTFRWRNARRVITGQVDGLLGQDIVGLATTRKTLLTRFHDGTGWIGGYAYNYATLVDDIALIQWDGADELDVAAYSRDGLEIVTGTPGGGATEIAFFPTHHSGGAIAVLPVGPSHAEERVALLTPDSTNAFFQLRLFDQTGELGLPLDLFIRPEQGAPLEAIQPYAMLAGDCDGDEDIDLVIAHTNFQKVTVLHNLWDVNPDGPPFGVGAQERSLHDISADPLQGSAGNTCVPAVGDVDQDGSADIAYPVDTANNVVVLLALPQLPTQINPTTELSIGVFQETAYGPDDPGQPTVGQSREFLYVPDEIFDEGYEYAHVVVWRQDAPGTSLQIGAVGNYLFQLETEPDPPFSRNWQGLPVDLVGAPVDYPWPNERPHYYLHVSFVNAAPIPGGGMRVTNATRTVTCGLTITPDLDPSVSVGYDLYLTGMPTAGAPITIHDYVPPPVGGGTFLGNLDIGVNVPLGRLPQFGQGLPDPGEPETPPRVTILWLAV